MSLDFIKLMWEKLEVDEIDFPCFNPFDKWIEYHSAKYCGWKDGVQMSKIWMPKIVLNRKWITLKAIKPLA